MFFIRLSLQLWSPLAGAAALFRLKSPSYYCTWYLCSIEGNSWMKFLFVVSEIAVIDMNLPTLEELQQIAGKQ